MTTKPLVAFAITTPWVQEVVQELQPPEVDVVFFDGHDWDDTAQTLPQADFVVTFGVPPAWVPLLKKCKLVQQLGVGYDNVDRPGLHAADILLTNTPPLTAEGVAEHTLMLILTLNKLVIPIHNSLRRGKFDQFGWRQNTHTLSGKTLGIVGLGRIGRQVARTAHGFGVKLIYNDLLPAPPELEQTLTLTRVPFETLLTQADIVTVHVPLTPLTRGMFDAAEFAQMKRGALFINTSRGPTYSMNALYESLTAHHLRGAGLDVFDPEPPPPQHPLLHLENVICTPHMASGTIERHYAIHAAHFENCLRMLNGKRPRNIITIEQE